MRKPFNGNFAVTQSFGGNPASYARFGLKGHNGIDYALPTGTPLVASISGKVVEATNDPSGYGLYIKIENAKEGSVLAHLQSFKVQVGQEVKEGQTVGYSNNTGNSTGPHLHWGYYRVPRDRSNGYGGFVDQDPFLKATPPVTSSPSTPSMPTDFERKKSGQVDKIAVWLTEIKEATDSGTEQYFDNPADPDEFLNKIKAVYAKAKAGSVDPNCQAKVQQAVDKGNKALADQKAKFVKDLEDVVAKLKQ